MKSVRSPVHPGGARRGRFQLQQNHAPINVYSQLPRHEEDESQYQEDSFCVGSEEEGYLFVCVCVLVFTVCVRLYSCSQCVSTFAFMFTVCMFVFMFTLCVCVCVLLMSIVCV